MNHFNGDLRVRQVETARDRERFLRLPWSLYANDPAWVPPLLPLLRDRLSRKKNPFFRHAEVACFVAERRGEVVGRISTQICQLVQVHDAQGTGHYGMFECENRPETARSLFDAAESWLKRQGMTRMLGPFDFSINEELGMLVDGFKTPPFVMMGHHRDYYQALLDHVGLDKEIDLLAYYLDISRPYTDRIAKIVRHASRDSRIQLKPIGRSEREAGLRRALDVFNDGWSDNWGYLPPTDYEVEHLVEQLSRLIDRGMVLLAEVEGETAGCMIVLPNLNELISDLNGRLLPIGWMKLLWRLRFASFRSVRVPLMGIRKKYQSARIGASIALSMIDRCRADLLPRGVMDCEMSWILDSNGPMRGILDAAGCESYKRYRIFKKALP